MRHHEFNVCRGQILVDVQVSCCSTNNVHFIIVANRWCRVILLALFHCFWLQSCLLLNVLSIIGVVDHLRNAKWWKDREKLKSDSDSRWSNETYRSYKVNASGSRINMNWLTVLLEDMNLRWHYCYCFFQQWHYTQSWLFNLVSRFESISFWKSQINCRLEVTFVF